MYNQNYISRYKTACCNQANAQWKNCLGYKNHSKEQRNQPFASGPSKGFVQNLKDKIVNLQNESVKLQSVKKPVKKKQKDYYCLMLRKINNLDKKLQNLEDLFVSHLNHTPNEVLNSNDNEPLHDYMDFYESVRSLVDLANRLKEDLLYKQCDNHMSNGNTLHINDRIQVLDSELQNLYTYLEQLQNYSNEINDPKKYFVQEHYFEQPFSYSTYEEGLRFKNRKSPDLKEQSKNRRKQTKIYNREYKNLCVNNPSSQYIGSYEADEESPVSCQCSRCNLHATICSFNSQNRRYSPNRFQGRPVIKDSDCSCVICVSERKNKNKNKNNNLWVSQSTSSCSCEICICNNQKCSNPNCKSPQIQIIKPPKNCVNEGRFFDELQISCHEMKPNQSIKRNKQKKNKNKLKTKKEDQNIHSETVYSSPDRPHYITNSKMKSEESMVLKKHQDKISRSEHFKSATLNNQETETVMDKVVYYEVTPELNIITKRKNNIQVYNNGQEHLQGENKFVKKNTNTKDEVPRNGPFRLHTVNCNLREGQPTNKHFKKVVKDKRNSHDYDVIDMSSSSENKDIAYVRHPDNSVKKYPAGQTNENKNNGSMGKHLHVTFRKKKEFEEELTAKQKMNRSPQCQYRHNHSHLYHRQYDDFSNIQDAKYGKKTFANKRFPHFYPRHSRVLESDSFDTVEGSGSESDSCSQCKLFVCTDPHCIEKLDSDELIMLMNKFDSTSFGHSPYYLNISESVKDLKSDVCNKCIIKEKTISVTPHQLKNSKDSGKAKIVITKKIIECENCKNKKDDHNITVNNFDTEKNLPKFGGPDSIGKNKRLNNSSRQEDAHSIDVQSNDKSSKLTNKYNGNTGGNKNKQGINKQESNKSQNKKLNYSSSYTDNDHNIKEANNLDIRSKTKNMTVVHTSLDQTGSLKMLRGDENNSSKALEVQGFGNTININIERGSYPLSHQPDHLNKQNGTSEENDSLKINLDNPGNINKSPRLKAGAKDAETQNEINCALNRPYLMDGISEILVNTMNYDIDDISRSIPNQPTKENVNSVGIKSRSVLDLAMNNRQETKDVITVKSEIFRKLGNNNSLSVCKEEGKQNYYDKDTSILVKTDDIINKKDSQTLHSKGKLSSKTEMFLNNKTLKKQGNLSLHGKNFNYIYGTEHEPASRKKYKIQPILKTNSFEPKLSITRLKRNRLKYNKNFGSSLSKVSSVSSIVLQKAKLYPADDCPSKKSSIFNPGRRRSNKVSKHRHNNVYQYPRLSSVKENSMSRIMKPQVEILVRESYPNNLKVPSNDCSNIRYKVASVSNYLSSAVTSETSYSTLNWEKVANKLKEDDNYFNEIA